MPIIARDKGDGFVPAPAGTHAAICCDVVDLGVLEQTWGGETKKQHKVNIIWQIDESMDDSKPYRVQKRYTLSLHEMATLRKDLESWRGRPFTLEEAQGFDLETLLGVPALLNVIHNIGSKGGTFANVASIMRLPRQMEAPKIRDYVRVCHREPTQGIGAPVGAHAEAAWGDPTDDEVPF